MCLRARKLDLHFDGKNGLKVLGDGNTHGNIVNNREPGDEDTYI